MREGNKTARWVFFSTGLAGPLSRGARGLHPKYYLVLLNCATAMQARFHFVVANTRSGDILCRCDRTLSVEEAFGNVNGIPCEMVQSPPIVKKSYFECDCSLRGCIQIFKENGDSVLDIVVDGVGPTLSMLQDGNEEDSEDDEYDPVYDIRIFENDHDQICDRSSPTQWLTDKWAWVKVGLNCKKQAFTLFLASADNELPHYEEWIQYVTTNSHFNNPPASLFLAEPFAPVSGA